MDSAAPSTPALRRPKVLAVDDDLGVQRLLSLFLAELGADVVTATTGREALLALSSQKFDICLLDLQLPDMVGADVYVEAQFVQPELIFIVVTGLANMQIIDRMLEHGAVTILKKPLRMAQLKRIFAHFGFGKPAAAPNPVSA